MVSPSTKSSPSLSRFLPRRFSSFRVVVVVRLFLLRLLLDVSDDFDDDEDVSDDFEDEDVSDEDVSDDESSRRRFVAIGLLFLVLQSRRSSRNDVNDDDDACKSFSFRGRTRDDGRLFMPTLRTTLRTTTTGW